MQKFSAQYMKIPTALHKDYICLPEQRFSSAQQSKPQSEDPLQLRETTAREFYAYCIHS